MNFSFEILIIASTCLYVRVYILDSDLARRRINTYFYGSQQQQSNVQSITASHINIQCREQHSPGINKVMEPAVLMIYLFIYFEEENILFEISFY